MTTKKQGSRYNGDRDGGKSVFRVTLKATDDGGLSGTQDAIVTFEDAFEIQSLDVGTWLRHGYAVNPKVDLRWDRPWHGGGLQSRGDGDFSLIEGDESGEVESTLTAVYPYAKFGVTEKVDLWGMVGLGTGDVTLGTARGEQGQGGRSQIKPRLPWKQPGPRHGTLPQ